MSSVAGLGRPDCEHGGVNKLYPPGVLTWQQQQPLSSTPRGVGDGRCPAYKGSRAWLGKRSARTARAVSLPLHSHTPSSLPPSLLSLSRASERAQSPRVSCPPRMRFRVQVSGIMRVEGLLQDYQHRLPAADLSNLNLRFQGLDPHCSNAGFRTWPLNPSTLLLTRFH